MAGTYLTPVGSGIWPKSPNRGKVFITEVLQTLTDILKTNYFNNTDLIQICEVFYPLQTVLSYWKYRPLTLCTYYTCTYYITILTKKWANFIPYHNLKSNYSKFFNFIDLYKVYRTPSCHISHKTILNKREQSRYIHVKSNSSRNLNLNDISVTRWLFYSISQMFVTW